MFSFVVILLMEEILNELIGGFSHYFQGFTTVRHPSGTQAASKPEIN